MEIDNPDFDQRHLMIPCSDKKVDTTFGVSLNDMTFQEGMAAQFQALTVHTSTIHTGSHPEIHVKYGSD